MIFTLLSTEHVIIYQLLYCAVSVLGLIYKLLTILLSLYKVLLLEAFIIYLDWEGDVDFNDHVHSSALSRLSSQIDR